MAQIIQAIYEHGVFKPMESVNLKEYEKVNLIVNPYDKWRRDFQNLLDHVHKKTSKYSSEEIESDKE